MPEKPMRQIWKRIIAGVAALALGLVITTAGERITYGAQGPPVQSGHTVVFMTDFGTLDDSVAICKAVMLRLDPTLRIMDITHQVAPYSILDGARFLA